MRVAMELELQSEGRCGQQRVQDGGDSWVTHKAHLCISCLINCFIAHQTPSTLILRAEKQRLIPCPTPITTTVSVIVIKDFSYAVLGMHHPVAAVAV